jgi:hypothetical protein
MVACEGVSRRARPFCRFADVVDVPTAALACVSAFLLLRYRVNSTWLVLSGALLGAALPAR